MNNLLLIISLIFVGQTLGSLVGLIKKPKKTILCSSLAFAASMMLGISFFQLIPESLEHIPVYLVALSFFAGVGVMYSVDKLVPHINPESGKKERPSIERTITMLVIGMALHNLPEGLAIGVGFALDPALGIVVALGIAAQDVPENIATIVPLYGLTKKKLKSFVIVTATILFEVLGFIFGYCFLEGMPLEFLGISLVLAAGFMTYISIEELIPAAQIKQNLKAGLAAIALGLMCVLLLGLLG